MSAGSPSRNLDRLRARLERDREELLESLAANADAADTVELDQTRQGRVTRIDALQQQEMAKASQAAGRDHLAAINAALQRMRQGDYGACLECGEPIAPARLEARPEARLCIECMAQSEQA